ncbi:MAG: NAD(P)H-hydrate dehydratase [Elusimicrobia bacterium]|jgi:NAD(P)H-hydrate epimerase|nr:NAD(P)H-hydrate dehydratase [Elusimicrobiota bacterium]
MKALSKTELREALVRREPADHKGVFGHVLVVAGSRNMAGAAVLAARAALRSGAGLVTAAAPAGIQAVLAQAAPEALSLGLPENAAGCLRPEGVSRLRATHREAGYSALAIGPGLSRSPDTAKFVLLALSALPLPAVVDADALNILAAQEAAGVRQLMKARKLPCIFTPHPGEMARCLGCDIRRVREDRMASAERLARDWNGVALLKGRGTLVSSGSRTAVNPTGCPGLAKGGTGDVLTGLVAGLWAQMLASGRGRGDLAFWAAALGAWLHGRAGELAEAEKTGYAMTAQDVIAHLPGAFQELL